MNTQLSSLLLMLFLLFSCADTKFAEGKRVYTAYCSNCHIEDGTGLGKLIPPLAGADFLASNQDKVACIIRNGLKGPIQVNGVIYDQEMPGAELTDVQISNLINYINTAWGNEIATRNISQIKSDLGDCPTTND